jgi:diphthine methyl ester synthase
MVESSSDQILQGADTSDIAFLVVGDPFGHAPPNILQPKTLSPGLLTANRATTHTDLALRARGLGITTRTVHNASILTAVGAATGLSLYRFGQTVSMVFFADTWRPDSFYERAASNAQAGLHTLVLLDIKVREPDLVALARAGGPLVYEPPRFMSAAVCIAQMLEVEDRRREGVCAPRRLAVALARVGADTQAVAAGTLDELAALDLGEPLHSVVLLGSLTYQLEWEFLRAFAVDAESFDKAWEEGGYSKS